MNLSNPLDIFALIAGIGALAAGLGFGYSQLKVGAGQAKDDLIKTLKETAMAEKERAERLAVEKLTLVTSHQNQITELSKEVGMLKGLFQAAEKEKQAYLTILQGRNPEQIEFMKYITSVAKGSAEYMRESSEILSEIRKFMVTMNEEIVKGNKFNDKLKSDTKHAEGKPVTLSV